MAHGVFTLHIKVFYSKWLCPTHLAQLLVKMPGFLALHICGRNESRFLFAKYHKKYFFAIFGCWLLPEKIYRLPKNIMLCRTQDEAAVQSPSTRS